MSKNEMPEERRLIGRAVEGDANAYGLLYERYLDAIYRYIYFRVGNPSDAEDLTEEVFVKGWEAITDFKLGPDQNFSAWLYRIAHNLVVDHHRKRRPAMWSSEQLANEETRAPSVEATARLHRDAESVAQAVQQLTDLEQEVIILRFVEGLSHKEIANVIGKSEGASRVIQHRALKSLKALLST